MEAFNRRTVSRTLALSALILGFTCAGVSADDPAAAEPAADQASEPERDPTFLDVVASLKAIKFHRGKISGVRHAILIDNAEILDQTSAVPAIYQLWASGETTYAHLLWWIKDDRLSRFFIATLFLASVGVEGEAMCNFPVLEPARFRSPESERRSQEIALIKKHRSALAALLVEIFRPVSRTTPNYRRFQSIAAAKMGDPLPAEGISLPE
jgi:hypothetical protein